MPIRLKPLSRQTVVITGASSGIGLVTARSAAAQGAKLVLAARNGEALAGIVDEIRGQGGQAVAVAADVGRHEDVERIADAAIDAFGGFDSWVNNAGVAIYGTMEEVPLDDQRRLFDINYWGVVHGSLVAAKHLRQRGGAIVNVGSVLSDRAVILQGPYCATKHAVKAATDTLRMELRRDRAPVSVTLIKPGAIDTPYMEHARNYTDSGTKNPPPSYDPQLVARAILFACEHPRRDLTIGFGGWIVPATAAIAPGLVDRVMETFLVPLQKTENRGRPAHRDNLQQPREDGSERSALPGGSRRQSLFLEAQMRPGQAMLAVAGLVLLAGMARSRRRRAAL